MLELGIGETRQRMPRPAAGHAHRAQRHRDDIGEIDRAKDEHFDKSTLAQKASSRASHGGAGGFQRAGKLVRITARSYASKRRGLDTIMVTRPSRICSERRTRALG